jgi:hypothetical protein
MRYNVVINGLLLPFAGFAVQFFFLERAGELRIIKLREEKESKMDQDTKPKRQHKQTHQPPAKHSAPASSCT